MKIIRNSAKCTACGAEIESTHRHDFNVHYCKVEPTPEKKWVMVDGKHDHIAEVPGETTWRFAVDGGTSYLKRCGGGYEDTSIYEAAGIRTYEDGMPS
jgi:hypothetical protein